LNFSFIKDQTIISLKESRIENGQIYCRVERASKTVVDEKSFDMTTQEFYLMISSGSQLRENSIGYHNINRDVSSLKTLFTEDNPLLILPLPVTTIEPDENNDIYKECAKTKSCIGLPENCVSSRNCLAFGAVIVKNGSYEFEMMSPSE
jgi:hypothetical protein